MKRETRLGSKEWQAIRRIIEGFDPERIVLFGSYARGDVHQGSDVDLLLIKETNEPFLRRLDAVLDLCDGTVALEPRVYTPAELARMQAEDNDFIHTILKEGIVIYERQQSEPRPTMAGPGQP